MGAFEKLQGYSSGLSANKSAQRDNSISEELEKLNQDYDKGTPLGYFLQKLHTLGYKVTETVYRDGFTDDIISSREYEKVSDEIKGNYTKEIQYTEFAKMLLSDGDNLVISGAGSGKTTALVFKIMKDILTGEATKTIEVGEGKVNVVDDIFIGTFLKSGADELKATLESWQRKLGYIVTTDRMHFGTLHAEFKRALNTVGVKTPIGKAEQISECLKRAVDTLHVCRADGGKLGFEDYTAIESIVTYYRNRIGTNKYGHPACAEYGLNPVFLDTLVTSFAQNRINAGIMDFEDLQELLYKYLYITPNKAVQDFVAGRYKYIYLDEFQDTSEVQYEIIKFYARGRLDCNRNAKPMPDNMFDGLYTGERTKGKIIAIGDDDQCLLPDTPVLTKEGYRPIKEITPSTEVATYNGNEITYSRVESVSHKAFYGKKYAIITKSGKMIEGTKEHICFARVPETEHAVWLTYHKMSGFELGMIPDGERNWCLSICDTLAEAIDTMEGYLKLYDLDITSSTTTRLLAGEMLLNDLGYNSKSPHRFNNTETKYGVVTMFDKGVDSTFSVYESGELQSETIGCVDYVAQRGNTSSFGKPYFMAKFCGETFMFTQLGNIIKGMEVPVYNPETGVCEIEVVENVVEEHYSGDVYDINVSTTRNFIAGDIIVHNCIYSWRGSDISVMTEKFLADFEPTVLKLSKNYRCPANILNPILPSIVKNQKRFPKNLVSANDGGEFNAYHFTSVTPMLSHLLEQIDDDMAKGRNVAIICRTNFDGVIPAFLLEMDHRYTFSVSSEAMTLNSALPRSILNASRLLIDNASRYVQQTLNMLVNYRDRYEAKALYDKLKADSSIGVRSNIFTLDEADIAHSAPSLIGFIRGMKKQMFDENGKRTDEGNMKALRFMYYYMLSNVYGGDSSYCLRVRSYIEAVLYLINTKNFESVSDFLMETSEYSERLRSRIRRKDVKISIVTVHEFKGKERDAVYLWHDSDQFFPASKTDLTIQEQVEEERRVHYIACTRAKQKCVVYALKGSHGMFFEEMEIKPVDPTVQSVRLTPVLEVNPTDSCEQEEEKLKANLAEIGSKTESVELPDVENKA